MLYRVVVPAQPTETVPAGAALLAHGRGTALMQASDESFGECCAKAARHGTLVKIPGGANEIGTYDETYGELRLRQGGADRLAIWLGHPISRGDLEARENRTVRRGRARRLLYEGRVAEAFRIDRRMGL